MSNWLLYLLEANIYVAVFYAFYLLVLKRETFSSINRWFLLAGTMAAFVLPLAKVELAVLTAPNIAHMPDNLNDRISALSSSPPFKPAAVIAIQNGPINYADVLIVVCVSVSAILVIKFALNILNIVRLYRRSEKVHRDRGITHVLLYDKEDVFSFFSWLFYHPKFKNNEAILAHEEVHIRQKHSLDLLFFGLLRAFNWFNPVFKYLLNDVRINHEFIADEIAAAKCATKYQYATLLIGYADSNNAYPLAHAMFSSNQLKNRINFLAKKRSPKIARLKLLFALPVLIVGLFISAFKVPKQYGIFKIRLAQQPLKVHTNMPATKAYVVKQYDTQVPQAKQVPQKLSSSVAPLSVSKINKSADVSELAALDDLYSKYIMDWKELDGQLADIIAERDAIMKGWRVVVENNASAQRSYQRMSILDEVYKPAELNLSEAFLNESINATTESLENSAEDERVYLKSISLLVSNYQQFQVATSKLFKLNTTDPAINKQYYLDRVAKREEFYTKVDQLFKDINNDVSRSAAYNLQLALINFKIYCKKDEINDKINQRNGVVRARNLLTKPIT
nr:M56 family metallopeptidase [uncultured Mucilaginibacter sp.]